MLDPISDVDPYVWSKAMNKGAGRLPQAESGQSNVLKFIEDQVEATQPVWNKNGRGGVVASAASAPGSALKKRMSGGRSGYRSCSQR